MTKLPAIDLHALLVGGNMLENSLGMTKLPAIDLHALLDECIWPAELLACGIYYIYILQ